MRTQNAALILLLGSVSCFAYVPSPTGRAVPDESVQLTLTAEGSLVLAPQIGPSIAMLEGRLVADSGEAYVISGSRTTRRDGAETDWRGEKVAIAHPLAAEVATRQLSRTRTVAFSALTTGLVAALTEAFAGGSGGSVSGAAGGGARTGK